MASQSIPYIEREAAEQFLQALDDSLTSESKSSVVFNVWGIGGVGKSTLLGKVEERVAEKADCVRVYFGLTEGIDSPLGLMETLFKGLVKADDWGFRSEFLDLYQRYKDTLNQLETVPVKGRQVDEKQIKQVQTLVNLGVGLLQKGMPEDASEAWGAVGKNAVAGAVAALSVKDEVGELLRSHKATKKDRELQELMLEPLPKLTAAFAANLRERGKARPVVLILDTYEKASQEMDDWLGRSLVGNQALGAVRIVVAGRNRLVAREGWRKLRQDRDCLEETGLERFDLEQTQRYLHGIGVEDDERVEQVFGVTKGLPYYLDWIRRERERGQELDFSSGNEAIVQLLLQGLNAVQRRVVELAACCRRFNRQLIQLLVVDEGLAFETATDSELDCFEWLKQQDFVESAQGRYRLDDVARDVFRQSLLEADEERFKAVQGALADYFVERSDGIMAVEESPRLKYEDEDWRRARAEYLYHLLLSRRKTIQLEFRSHVLEAQHFGQQSRVTMEPLVTLAGEFALSEHPLLEGDSGTRRFLQQIGPAVGYGWSVLEEVPLDYGKCKEQYGLSKQAVDGAWGKLLEQPEQLTGLAQFVAYIYKSGRGLESLRLKHLQQAQMIAQNLVTEADSEFSSRLFAWYLGDRFYDFNALHEAITNYGIALQIKPDDYEIWVMRGALLCILDLNEEAVENYDAALKIKPNDYDTWHLRGNSLSELGKKDEAIASYDKAIELQPDYHISWSNRGNSLDDLDRKEEAIASYDKAIEIKPDYHQAWTYRGDIYRKLGQHEQAFVNLNQAIELKADDTWAINTRGETYTQIQQYVAALKDFDRVIQIDPKDTFALGGRGFVLLMQGKHNEALKIFNTILEEDLESEGALICRAFTKRVSHPESIQWQDDLSQAIQLAQTEHNKDRDDWNNHFNLALYHLAAGHHPEADRLHQTGLTTAPTWAIRMAQRGLRDYLQLFPEDPAAQTWHQQLEAHLNEADTKER